MPCEPFTSRDGKATGWICSRTKPKPQRCYKCGKPAKRLCDFRDYEIREIKDEYGILVQRHKVASISTCNRPMCSECANRTGRDVDFCDEHFNEFDMAKTERAEKVHRERMK